LIQKKQGFFRGRRSSCSSGGADQKHTFSRSPSWFVRENLVCPVPCRTEHSVRYT